MSVVIHTPTSYLRPGEPSEHDSDSLSVDSSTERGQTDSLSRWGVSRHIVSVQSAWRPWSSGMVKRDAPSLADGLGDTSIVACGC